LVELVRRKDDLQVILTSIEAKDSIKEENDKP